MPTPIQSDLQLTPRDLGLPAKFSAWRPGQWEAIIDAVNHFESGTRFIAGNLPTGTGKSGIGIGVSVLLGGRTVTLTSTKGLQDQYGEFSPCGLVDLRGRQNYTCLSYPTCADGRVSGCAHSKPQSQSQPNDATGDCPYLAARDQYLSSSLSVTNYACYFANNMHGEGMGSIDLLILDEAHNALEELSAALTIILEYDALLSVAKKIALPDPPTTKPPDHWRSWAKLCTPSVKSLFDQVKRDGGHSSWLRIIDGLKSSLGRVETVPDDWIIDETNSSQVTFAPLWPTNYAEEHLFRNVKHVLLISATIVPKTLELLGISPADSHFITQSHSFDPRRCPVYLFGASRIDFRTTPAQMSEMVSRMDSLIDKRLDRKGVIHPVSYDRASFIHQNSAHQGLMIAPKGKMLHDSLNLFRTSPPPRILISPAITTGYDFPGAQCEYQFIIKVPFIDARSPILKARATADPEYIPYLTAQILTQTCGRGMRSPTDQCENFILDQHANWFLRAKDPSSKKGGYRHLFPSWFLAQVNYPRSQPIPPPKLAT